MDSSEELAGALSTPPALTVSELNRMARRALESQLPLLWIEGEISNFTRAASGHWYFALKDEAAQVRCVMFRGRNQFADFTPANGDHVEVRALPSLYEARGEFQLGVELVRRAGAGRLYEAFIRLKAKLEAEGLFDPGRKRALPRFPRTLGVVTSPQAAALHDVLTALARRMPGLGIVLYPTPVQGTGAGAEIAAAIRVAGARAECDVLLVCRGGGSLEDLWAFNDEAVVRAVAASPIPVISAVGHETDFTLTDFAADLRAPTPTAGAELASPARLELRQQLAHLARQLCHRMQRKQHDEMQRLDYLTRRLLHPAEQLQRQREAVLQLARRLGRAARASVAREAVDFARLAQRLSTPLHTIRREGQRLDGFAARSAHATAASLARRRLELERLDSNLTHLNPDAVLARGYSIVHLENGAVVQDAGVLGTDTPIGLRFHRGRAQARVESTSPD